jgi:signal transduction histidine kinase
LPSTRYRPAEDTLYRILQEATNNIVKHAGADRVRVRLDRVDNVLNLLIEDNGSGFDPGSIQYVEGQGRGLGLLSMKERASFSGGTYHLTSAPGQGTTEVSAVRAIFGYSLPPAPPLRRSQHGVLG